MLILILFIVPVAYAESSGSINFSVLGGFPILGLTGSVVDVCNSTSSCQYGGFQCYIDFDEISIPASRGWCNVTSLSSCFHNSTLYASAYTICSESVVYTCNTNNSWTPSACDNGCANTTACADAAAAATTSSSSSSGGSGSVETLKITSVPVKFNATQASSVMKEFTVRNTGDTTLYNVSLSFSVDWYSIAPEKIEYLYSGISKVYNVTFNVPVSAELKEYNITATASTPKGQKATSTFLMRVVPSNKTVQEQILPLYSSLSKKIADLETVISNISINSTEAAAIMDQIREKMAQAKAAIDSGDFFAANNLLQDIDRLIDEAKTKLVPPAGTIAELPLMIIAAAAVTVIAIIIVLYLFWPVNANPVAQSKPIKSSEKE